MSRATTGSHLRVVALQDAAGAGELVEELDQAGLQTLHALAQRLDHQVVAVAVYDQGGQSVGLSMDHAVGVADSPAIPHPQRLPPLKGLGQAVLEKGLGQLRGALDEAELDVGPGRVERVTQERPQRSVDPDDGAGR
jgi:hypothetical protein